MSFSASPAVTNLASDVPGFLFIDHVAIAIPRGDLEQHVAAYRLMGFREIHRETAAGPDQVAEVLMRIGESPNLIQLQEPLSPESPVQRALDRNGGRAGLNHVAFRVRDIDAAHAYFQREGFKLVDPAPQPGSRGSTVFFVHPNTLPETALRVLIEVVQE